MPETIIRLAAGRNILPESQQAMCFMAGANAVFTGEQMLTTPCKSLIDIPGRVLNFSVPWTGSPWDEVSTIFYFSTTADLALSG